MAKNKSREFVGPKSICFCGHTGDGNGSEHHDETLVKGHGGSGKCRIKGCLCERFTWKLFTKKFNHYLSTQKKGG